MKQVLTQNFYINYSSNLHINKSIILIKKTEALPTRQFHIHWVKEGAEIHALLISQISQQNGVSLRTVVCRIPQF